MFVDDEHIKNYLEQLWNKYVRSSYYYNSYYIFEIPKNVFYDYLSFMKKRFKQDVLFEYLYNEYEKFIKEKYKVEDYSILDKNDFEKHLSDIGMKTYIVMDDNYEENKYICFCADIHK